MSGLERTIEQAERIDAFVSGQIDAHMAYIDAERKVTELEREAARLRADSGRLWQMCYELAANESFDDVITELNAMKEGWE